MGIDPRSRYYHPDNIAKRAAQEAVMPAKPVPLTALERYEGSPQKTENKAR